MPMPNSTTLATRRPSAPPFGTAAPCPAVSEALARAGRAQPSDRSDRADAIDRARCAGDFAAFVRALDCDARAARGARALATCDGAAPCPTGVAACPTGAAAVAFVRAPADFVVVREADPRALLGAAAAELVGAFAVLGAVALALTGGVGVAVPCVTCVPALLSAGAWAAGCAVAAGGTSVTGVAVGVGVGVAGGVQPQPLGAHAQARPVTEIAAAATRRATVVESRRMLICWIAPLCRSSPSGSSSQFESGS